MDQEGFPMEKTGVVRLAKVLRLLVTITFLCNLVALILVPGLVGMYSPHGVLELYRYETGRIFWEFLTYWIWVWQAENTAALTLFLLFCGSCTAVLLWQGRRLLGSIIEESPFSRANARNMRRAAVCCFLIALAALLRMVWGFFYYGAIFPLFTYNALFIPIFTMAGLLCMVMSALFRQAAELKEENDLTI